MSNNSIIGTWKLVTFEFRKEDNSIIYPFGAEARGSVIYTESGRFSGQLMRIDRPKFAIPDQMKGTSEEIEASYKGSISYFGTYDIDTDHGMVHHFVEGSIFPNMEGTQQKRFYELNENQLTLTTPPFKVSGERAAGIIIWERVE